LGFHNVVERARPVRPVHVSHQTPSCNDMLEQRLGDFATLAEGLDYAARGETGFDFYSPRGELAHQLPYRRLRDQALITARRLLGTGLARGDRVAVVAETGPEFMAVFFACQYAGLVPCPVPYSMHIGGRDAYVARIAGMLGSAQAAAVIAPSDLEGQIGEAAGIAGVRIVLSHEELAELALLTASLSRFEPMKWPTSSIPPGRPPIPRVFSSPRRRSPTMCAASSDTGSRPARATEPSRGCRSITTWAWSASASPR
jgi:acyl-CoA synthetase (AMP-forming)/AMP-acid ligase II